MADQLSAHELANELEVSAGRTEDHATIAKRFKKAAGLLRQQADRIAELEDRISFYKIKDLDK